MAERNTKGGDTSTKGAVPPGAARPTKATSPSCGKVWTMFAAASLR